MEELLNLLERYLPGYRQQVRGYPDLVVDELEEVFGHPLPESYRQFANVMGAQGGPLFQEMSSYDPIQGVAENYRLAPESVMPPRRFLFLFGSRDPLVSDCHWLDLDAPTEDGDYQVVLMPFGEHAWKKNLRRIYSGFREMLFLKAMTDICLPTFPHQVKFSGGHEGKASSVDEVARIFERGGFIRLPHPHHSMIFERPGAAIRLYRPPRGSRFYIHAGAHRLDELHHLQRVLEDNTDVEHSSSSPVR
ncbi:SMI1/KNR4 family protein [Myxococcus sp. CA056]|uniref:SMI1/KNR4 family protein n=1 Tax=Myxococcus sp. CA056 TaxID=2741740 RepID=UPI00157A230B|nr:SMI1/KNR4 family protein [Myxococcus sp. CA056]NTX10872.1 SMI1/KNR4 family protein [Myxococcus sp. CA056]